MNNTYRVIVAGGRKFCSMPTNPNSKKRKMMRFMGEEIQTALAKISAILTPERVAGRKVEIICGMAMGADTVGRYWAEFNQDVTISYWEPDWYPKGQYFKGAGHLRNCEMGDHASEEDGLLIDFYDGESPGSKQMINYAAQIGLETIIVPYDAEDYP